VNWDKDRSGQALRQKSLPNPHSMYYVQKLRGEGVQGQVQCTDWGHLGLFRHAALQSFSATFGPAARDVERTRRASLDIGPGAVCGKWDTPTGTSPEAARPSAARTRIGAAGAYDAFHNRDREVSERYDDLSEIHLRTSATTFSHRLARRNLGRA